MTDSPRHRDSTQRKAAFQRPPRIQPPLPIGQEEIPAAPDQSNQASQSMAELLLPATTIIGYLLLSLGGQGRNILVMLPMTIAMVFTIYISWRRSAEARRKHEEQVKAYRQTLANLRDDMRRTHLIQREFYNYNYPNLTLIRDMVERGRGSRYGMRLWERRSTDPDFGMFRLGVGIRPSLFTYEYKANSKDESTDMSEEAMRLSADSRFLQDAPLTLLIRPPTYEPPKGTEPERVVHSVGIFGVSEAQDENPHKDIREFVSGMVMQYTAFHSPSDAKLYIAGASEAKQDWRWCRQLQHTRTDKEQSLLCFAWQAEENSSGFDETTAFFKSLRIELQGRQQRLNDRDSESVTLPFILLIIDLLKGPDTLRGGRTFHEFIVSNEAVITILQSGQQLGAAVFFVVAEDHLIPGDVLGVIELEKREDDELLRYSETGINSRRYLGAVDADVRGLTFDQFTSAISRYSAPLSASAALPATIDLLQLNRVANIEDLSIQARWEDSTKPENAEWPSVPIGMKVGGEVRKLTFSAEGEADGVHGMIAGTTGSGKSELLLTLIVGLAIRYDPSIVNFVLVDFKGGAAFEEFTTLPHCVDIVTNLGANAVDRMFNAIRAELDRRSKIIADYKVKDIQEYRRRDYHRPFIEGDPMSEARRQRMYEEDKLPKDRLPQPFPHLFIIIDEFAEMVALNPEYKAQLDSITRLGRAIGVSLILATQRPAGMITDQMRANMKFKICLRVETPDDSRELLRTSDAAYLPTGANGRAYIQIGNNPPEVMQVARAGGDYEPAQEPEPQVSHTRLPVIAPPKDSTAPEPAIRFKTSPTTDNGSANEKQREAVRFKTPIASGTKHKQGSTKLSGKLVEVMANLFTEERPVREQLKAIPEKPWPSSLPIFLSLRDDLHLKAQLNASTGEQQERAKAISLFKPSKLIPQDAERLIKRQGGSSPLILLPSLAKSNLWKDKDASGLELHLGLIDNPRAAHQRLLTIDFSKQKHVAIFGSGGWGKTAFLQSIIISLASNYPPTHLHIYILDFGKRNLASLRELPHVGDIIFADEPDVLERFNRLLRMLDETVRERAKTNPPVTIPFIVVVIENFSEIKENYEPQQQDILNLMRQGRSLGVYFVASAENFGAMGNKLFNQFNDKITLHMTDAAEYLNIVGRSGFVVPQIAGRGLIAVDRAISSDPLELQIALPVSLDAQDMAYVVGLEEDPESQSSKRFSLEVPNDRLSQLVQDRLPGAISQFIEQVKQGWGKHKRRDSEQLPKEIGILKPNYALEADVLKAARDNDSALGALVGIRDDDLQSFAIPLTPTPHFMVLGPPLSGRTTLLRTWITSLIKQSSERPRIIVMIDPQERLILDEEWKGYSQHPNVFYIKDKAGVVELISKLTMEYEYSGPKTPQDIKAAQERYENILREEIKLIKRSQRDAEAEYKQQSSVLESLKSTSTVDSAPKQSVVQQRRDTEAAVKKAKSEFERFKAELERLRQIDEAWEKYRAKSTNMNLPESPEIYLVIDNFDELPEMLSEDKAEDRQLSRLAKEYRREGLHVILAGSDDMMRMDYDLRVVVSKFRYGFVLRSGDMATQRMQARLRRDLQNAELPVGRGFFIRSGSASVIQIAQPGDMPPPPPAADESYWLIDRLPKELRDLDELERRVKEREKQTGSVTNTSKLPDLAEFTERREKNMANNPWLVKALHKLSPDQINVLEIKDTENQLVMADDILSRDPQVVQSNVEAGLFLLPEQVDPALELELKNRIQLYDLLVTQGALLALTLQEMERLGITYTTQDAFLGDFNELQAAVRRLTVAVLNEELMLPNTLADEALADVAAKVSAIRLLTLNSMAEMPPALLEQLGITLDGQPLTNASAQFYDVETKTLNQKRFRQMFITGKLVIPVPLGETLTDLQKFDQIIRFVDARRLKVMTESQLAAFGIELDGITAAELRQKKVSEIVDLIRTQRVKRPLALPDDQVKEAGKIKPYLGTD